MEQPSRDPGSGIGTVLACGRTCSQQLRPDTRVARERYRRFVDAGIGTEKRLWNDLVGGMYLGRETWLKDVKIRVDQKLHPREHPRAERTVGRPTMTAVLSAVAQTLGVSEETIRAGRGGTPRQLAAWVGFNEALLTNTEIAAGLRMGSSGHITDLIKKFERDAVRNPDLQTVANACVSTLRGESGETKT